MDDWSDYDEDFERKPFVPTWVQAILFICAVAVVIGLYACAPASTSLATEDEDGSWQGIGRGRSVKELSMGNGVYCYVVVGVDRTSISCVAHP